jgi:hypothetical protein
MTDMTITEQGLTFDVAAFLKANAPYLRFADEGGDLTLLHVFNDNCFAFLYRKGKTHKAIEIAVWIKDDVKAVLEVKNYRGIPAIMYGWHPSTIDDALIASYCHRFLPLALSRLKEIQPQRQS